MTIPSFKEFLEFLEEKVNDNYLYHNTAFYKLDNILKDGVLKSPSGKGKISFSRSPLYNASPGTYGTAEVKFVFDRTKLQQRRKIVPYADLSVASKSGWRDDETVKGAERRWESEEQIQGPIPLTKEAGLLEIRVAQRYIDEHILRPIKVREDLIKDLIDSRIPKLEKENLFWNQVLKQWMPVESERQKKFHSVEGYKNAVEVNKKEIEEYKSIFKNPFLKIIS